MSVASVALGAVAIEKHFCHNRADEGSDSIFLMLHSLNRLVDQLMIASG